jgi:hypothetical protein
MKAKIKRTFRLLKALATDPRIPRPVRWLIGVSLAIKAVPFPDFGIDEVGLLIAFVLLSTIYRQQFNEIRAEIRRQEDLSQADEGTGQPSEDRADPDRTVDPHGVMNRTDSPQHPQLSPTRGSAVPAVLQSEQTLRSAQRSIATRQPDGTYRDPPSRRALTADTAPA